MKRLMNLLMLSCKGATTLIEKRKVEKLGAIENLQLKMHTSMCKACRSYESQSLSLDTFISKLFTPKPAEKKELSAERKEQILESFKGK